MLNDLALYFLDTVQIVLHFMKQQILKYVGQFAVQGFGRRSYTGVEQPKAIE
jgi:hypothetical protein